ncbi:MAG: hypothetical protein ACOX2Q_09390 [Dehalobacterium sp.]|jgi:drug/metabolite transporter (DMT)-like permease
MRILTDKIFAGVIIGVLADIVKLTFNYLGYLLGWSNVVFWQIVATRFLPKEDLFTPYAYLIGGIADLVMTASIAIVFLYALDFLGKENLWLKGPGLGLFLWVVVFGTLLGQSVENKLHQDSLGILVTLVAHLIYGVAIALFTELYYKILEKQGEAAEHPLSFVPQPARKVRIFRIKKEESLITKQKKKFITPRKI